MLLRFLFATVLLFTICLASNSDDAGAAYKRGARAEAKKETDAAFEAYKQAYTIKPREPKYIAAYLRSRSAAGNLHVSNGIKLREAGKLEDAMAQFQKAAAIDGTNFAAVQEL